MVLWLGRFSVLADNVRNRCKFRIYSVNSDLFSDGPFVQTSEKKIHINILHKFFLDYKDFEFVQKKRKEKLSTIWRVEKLIKPSYQRNYPHYPQFLRKSLRVYIVNERTRVLYKTNKTNFFP